MKLSRHLHPEMVSRESTSGFEDQRTETHSGSSDLSLPEAEIAHPAHKEDTGGSIGFRIVIVISL